MSSVSRNASLCRPFISKRIKGAAVAASLVWTAAFVTGLDAFATDEPARGHAERLEFDPRSGAWSQLAAPVAGTEQGDLQLARALLARNDFRAARKAFKKWRKAYPDSAQWAEGLFYSADTEVAAVQADASGHLMRAFRWYEEILDEWAGTEWAERSLRRELIIAEMFLFKGVKQWVWGGFFKFSATEEALDILNRLIDERTPGTELAEAALRLKADYHYQQGEFDEAEVSYARLARDFPRGRFDRLARLRSADSALANFPGVRFDDSSLLEAEARYQSYAAEYPEAAERQGVPERMMRIQESRARKEYNIGQYYERTDSPRAAVYYYRYVARTWPDTSWAAQSQHRLEVLGASQPSTPIEPEPAPQTGDNETQ